MEEILKTYERVYAKIDLDAIVDNMNHMKENIDPHTKMIGVIKTDGYGHGCVPIARCLEEMEYVYGYAVATPEEGHILRQAGIKKPILILGYTFPYAFELIAKEEIRPAVFREDSLQELSRAAGRVGKNIKVHIKVDTGMSRIGIRPDDSGIAFVRKLVATDRLEIEGIFTHFSRADETDKTNARKQLEIFTRFVHRIESELNIRIPYKHCSNSAGILELPEANMDIVRAGITLYGLMPSDEVRKDIVPLRPALSLHSKVVYVKTLHEGESISYGGTFTAKSQMRVATVPVGYGDGYPRSLSNKGYCLIMGKRAPILGRVCMDQFMVDVSDIPEATEGSEVTLIGKDGNEEITAEMLGDLSGRFNYELVCDLGKRIPRVFFRHGDVVGVKDYNKDYL